MRAFIVKKHRQLDLYFAFFYNFGTNKASAALGKRGTPVKNNLHNFFFTKNHFRL